MKRTLLTALTAALGLSASAQITLTPSDFGSIGTQVAQAHDTLPASSITPGASGTGQTWNFSALAQHYVDTITFTNPAWTPNAADFPTANLAILDGAGGIAYVKTTSASVTALGFAGDPAGTGNNVAVKNNPGELLMMWPSGYGTSFMQNFVTSTTFYYGQDPGIGFTVDSVRYNSHVTKYDSIDAAGSLITPLNTFNTVRMEEFRRQFDTIDIYVQPFGWQNGAYTQMDSTLSYSWWANGMSYMVAQINMDIPNGFATSATWQKTTPSPSSIDELAGAEVSAYPNPATDAITIRTGNANAAFINIYDMTGRKLQTADVSSSVTTVNVSSLAAGVYFYSVCGQDGALLNKSSFTVAK